MTAWQVKSLCSFQLGNCMGISQGIPSHTHTRTPSLPISRAWIWVSAMGREKWTWGMTHGGSHPWVCSYTVLQKWNKYYTTIASHSSSRAPSLPSTSQRAATAITSSVLTRLRRLQAPKHSSAWVDCAERRECMCVTMRQPWLRRCSTWMDVAKTIISHWANPPLLKHAYQGSSDSPMPCVTASDIWHAAYDKCRKLVEVG